VFLLQRRDPPTNLASFGTSKRVTVNGMDFYRVKDSQICEHWDCVDMLSLLKQLEAM